MTADSQWLNVQDIAEMLQIKDETVRRWIRRHELPVLELGGPRAGYRIRRDDLDHFIWQRYRMRNQAEPNQNIRSGLTHEDGTATSAKTVRVESVADRSGVVKQRISVSGDPEHSETATATDERALHDDDNYLSLMSRIPGITYVTAADKQTGESTGRAIAFVSQEFQTLLGASPPELRESETKWSERVYTDDRERVSAARRHSYQTGERLSIEYRLTSRSGEPLWIRDEAVLGDGDADKDPVWQGIILNISDRKRVEGTLQSRLQQHAVVAELGDRALGRVDLLTLMNETVQYVAQTLHVELATIFELLPGGEALVMRAGQGWARGIVGRGAVSSGVESQAGYTLLSNEPVIVPDLLEETRFDVPALLRDHGVRSGMSALIAGPGKPYGILGVHSRRPRSFAADDANFLRSVANILATSVIESSEHPASSRWLSIRDIADTLRVKEETVRRWIRRGELPVIDLGSSRAGYRIHPADLEYFIHERYMRS